MGKTIWLEGWMELIVLGKSRVSRWMKNRLSNMDVEEGSVVMMTYLQVLEIIVNETSVKIYIR